MSSSEACNKQSRALLLAALRLSPNDRNLDTAAAAHIYVNKCEITDARPKKLAAIDDFIIVSLDDLDSPHNPSTTVAVVKCCICQSCSTPAYVNNWSR
jgi:hypothetical protein